jgi:hypothetical protein
MANTNWAEAERTELPPWTVLGVRNNRPVGLDHVLDSAETPGERRVREADEASSWLREYASPNTLWSIPPVERDPRTGRITRVEL